MDRRRAAGLLLALAACIATATAAPTASNHTALDLYDGAPDGCYYNFQHYGEGDRIMTNEPCLNCTCHNRMLMCYLRVCPFTKPIGQDCTIEKRADQCCPIVTCPDVPVDLLTSTTTSPAEYGSTGIGKLDRFGCSINGKYFSEGSKVPPTPNKPCEHCYCIRNMTTCVMQECTLHVDGCTPIYHKDVCCPVRYSCDHPEDEMPLLDDLSTTVRPTPGFLLTTTTISPVTQMSQDCVYDNRVFPDGALIKTEKACDHCYCMKGDIVCVVQECGTPMENEGKNCTALPPREGVCCPDTYICEGDESTTGTYDTHDLSTHTVQEKLTTLSPPRRTSSEGSGYRNEPDEVPYTEMPIFEPEIEGSGEEEELKKPVEKTTGSPTPGLTEEIIASTEEVHEYIPLTTTKPTEEKTTDKFDKEDESLVSIGDEEKTSEAQPYLPSTTGTYSIKDAEELVTDKIQVEDIGSGELPEDISLKPHEEVPVTPVLSGENVATTEKNEQNMVTSAVTEREFSESQKPVTTAAVEEKEKTNKPTEQDVVHNDIGEKATSRLPIEHDFTSASPALTLGESIQTPEPTKSSQILEESDVKSSETPNLITTSKSFIENDVQVTTESSEQNIITSISDDMNESNVESQHYPSSSSPSGLDDEFVTTEPQEHEIATESVEKIEYFEPKPHITASTPMLEEIEKDTTEYTEPERVVPSSATQEYTFNILSTTISNDISVEMDKKDVTKSTVEEKISEEYVPSTTNIPEYERPEITTTESQKVSEILIETTHTENPEPEQYSSLTTTSTLVDSGRRTTQSDFTMTFSEDDSKHHDISSSTPTSALESEEVTTEPDKGLNTIPSDLIEEEISVSPEAQKTTLSDEKITTESDLDTRFNPSTDFTIIPSKLSTISDTSATREDTTTLTTESDLNKENYSPTEGKAGPELTTLAVDVTKKVISTLTHEHTDSVLDLQHTTATSTTPKYTESIEEVGTPGYESSITETSVSEKEKTTTSTPPNEKITETTTANQEDNEIFNEPRIPGEGDCLLNGITYTNESAVPSSNKCQSGCKCISSIVKCDPIICSPPPEYMNNCETMYDTPDACCPTYICDHKTETIPPQSHSQMSGTEAPVVSTVHCQGDECEIIEDKTHHTEPSDTCKSGTCAGPSDEFKETSSTPSSENIPEKPTTGHKDECADGKCTPILCTDENGCQATPVKPCEGEKCEITPDAVLTPEPQQCADGENCAVPSVPTKECSAGNCDVTRLEDTYPKETCTEKEGCQNVPNVSEKECNEDNCRRNDSTPLDQHVPEQCKEPGCKLTHTEMETSTGSVLDLTSQKELIEGYTKEVFVSETTEKLETPTESYTHDQETTKIIEPQEIVTKQPGITSDGILSTLPDNVALVTKFESVTEISTELAESTYKHEFIPESTKPESTKNPEYPLLVTTETSIKDFESEVSSSDATVTEIPAVSITPENDMITDELLIKTEHPQEFMTIEISTPEIIYREETTKTHVESSTDPLKVFTFGTQEVTESAEKVEPNNATHAITEESFTEPSKTYTLEPHGITKPSIELEHSDTTIEIAKERSTETPTTQDGMKSPEIVEHADTTITFAQERSTEPSRTFATDYQEITGATQKIYQEDITTKATVEDITESPMTTDNSKQENLIKEISDTSGTETTKIFETEDHAVNIGHTETALKPSENIGTETPAPPIDISVTETLGNDSTMNIYEEVSHEPPKSTSSESQDVTQLPNEIVHKETPSMITDETSTKTSKTISTEALEITKSSSEESDYEVTTVKISEKSSTEPSIPYTVHPLESTKSPQGDIGHEDITDKIIDESATVPPKEYSTESQLDTQSPEKVEHRDTSIKEISTEPTQRNATEPISPAEEDHHDTTFTTSEESSSKEPPKMYVTEPQELPVTSEETDQKDTTSKMSEEPGTEPPKMYSTEQQEITKAPEKIDYTGTTMSVLEETATEITKTYETETQEVSKLPEVVEQENTTSKISTEPYVTKVQDASRSPEVSTDTTTIKAIMESTIGISKPQEEVEHPLGVDSESTSQAVTENDVEIATSKSTIIDKSTKGPKEDKDMPSTETEISEITTTAKELLTSESVGLTTPSHIPDSKFTIPQEAIPEGTTNAANYDSESQPPQTAIDDVTEPSVKEQVSIVSVPEEHDIAITLTSVTSDSEHVNTSPENQITQKPNLETQTDVPTTVGFEKVSQPELQETLSTQQPEESEKDVTEPIDLEVHVPAFIPTDERRTTSSDLQELTTLKPLETPLAPHEIEITTDYPEASHTGQEDHRTETSTEELLVGTETPVVSEEIKTEKNVAVTEKDITKSTQSETATTSISSQGIPTIQEENYTEEPITKYSSPKPSEEFDATKTDLDESVSTLEPTIHESKQPDKPDDLIQSLVTGQHEISTKPSYLDQDSQTQIPIQVSTATPESDITQSSEQDNAEHKLSTLSSKLPDTALSELDNKFVTSTENAKPVEEEKRTESPFTVVKTESESTTQMEYLSEENATTQKPSVPEKNALLTSTISETKITTLSPDIKIVTETITTDTPFTKKQESATTDKPAVDIQEQSTESSYTAEVSETKVTMVDQPAVQEHTEYGQEVTKVPDVHIQKPTESSETVSSESTEVPIDIKTPASEPITEDQKLILSDITTEISDLSNKQPELTTFKPRVDPELSTLEPTTASKHEYQESTIAPSKDSDNTESTIVTESSNVLPSSEGDIEKQPETIQTVGPEREPPVEEYLTTRLPTEDILEKSTYPPILPEQDLTTPAHDIPPTIEHTLPVEEQSIPVVISETEKSSTTEGTMVVQTERVIPASEKPFQETTAPEEEFILATSETTTVKAEDNISSLSPTAEITTRPSEKPDQQPITTAPEAPITAVPDASITAFPKAPVTIASKAPVTLAPEVSVTTATEAPITAMPEAFITTGPETPVTAAPEVLITSVPETTATKVPEVSTAAAPEAPATTSPEPQVVSSEAPITTAPEAPVTKASEPQFVSSEAPVTTVPEAPVTKAPEPQFVSSEAPVTTVPEAPATKAPEPHITNAPEPPVTTASELPKPVPTEVQPTDEAPAPDEEGSFPPSGGTSGYGQEPDYVEEDQTFGPGTCRYGGKVYVSAQQIPRDDPCDFCFCFRSDIICLQQSCPPPIHGCHEEPIQGFCCPRYECPVSMATTVNVTTTTTTTTTTLPPHFPTHSYKGSVQKRGCQIKGQIYKVGEVVRASSGPCLHCTCGGDGQMKCDPKVCTPEPMLRQMIAAAVSAKRRR